MRVVVRKGYSQLNHLKILMIFQKDRRKELER